MRGFATQALGTDAVFVIDSFSYLVSAFFVLRTTIPQQTDESPPGPILRSAIGGILEGWRYLRHHAQVARVAVVKAIWSLGGGALVYMLALLGEVVTPNAAAMGIGLLLAVRGLGTASRFRSIARGVVDLRDLIYYLSLTGFFLAASVGALRARRWA